MLLEGGGGAAGAFVLFVVTVVDVVVVDTLNVGRHRLARMM